MYKSLTVRFKESKNCASWETTTNPCPDSKSISNKHFTSTTTTVSY